MQQQRRNNDLYRFPSERGKGLFFTILFHVALMVVLVITGFHTPLPLPEEEGILVNFGYDLTGFGQEEPDAGMSAPAEASLSIPEDGVSEQEAVTDPEEAVMTQEFEEAPVVEKKIAEPDPEAERRKREEAAAAEALRQKQLEEERIRRAAEEAERQRLAEEEAERQRQAEEAKRLNDIRNRTLNALSNSQGTGTGQNQGVAGGEGNQGVETGAAGATRYGEGAGQGDGGTSFDLAGRQALSLPKPAYDSQSEGRVVVEIWVDSRGNVTRANSGAKGSTTLDEYLLKIAREAAMSAKFDVKPGAIEQKGTITYIFSLR